MSVFIKIGKKTLINILVKENLNLNVIYFSYIEWCSYF